MSDAPALSPRQHQMQHLLDSIATHLGRMGAAANVTTRGHGDRVADITAEYTAALAKLQEFRQLCLLEAAQRP